MTENEGMPAMRPISRWNSALARRLALLMALPVAVPVILLCGAALGISEAVKETEIAVRNAWKGVR